MSKHSLRNFDPETVAKLETEMWQAYYGHKFFKLFYILIKLFKYQFGTKRTTSLRLAYYSATAAKTFRERGDEEATLKSLEKFYRLLLRYSAEDFAEKQAAESELNWWIIHRYPKQGSLAQALAQNMAILYSLSVDKLLTYGKYRAQAMEVRDMAAHKTKSEPDWTYIQKLLGESYISLHKVVAID